MALLEFLFQSHLVNALENCPNNPGNVGSIIGCDFKVVHLLSTLVNLDDWVQVVAHET